MPDIQPFLSSLPTCLQGRVAAHWQSFVDAAPEEASALDESVLDELVRVWAASDFVAQNCVRHRALLTDLLQTDLSRSYSEGHIRGLVDEVAAGASDEKELGAALRRLRRCEMVRIAWRDIAGRAALEETMTDLSRLADACIDGALERLDTWQREELGTPYGPDGEPQRLVVVGMGKLGADELNFSSDIDLILSYPEEGETRGGRRSLSNQEYFVRLGRRLVSVLGATTADGFVFRVDLRLRPFGESSAIALPFDAMEFYYQAHGREWERYAMIKARVVAGDGVAGKQLMTMLHPFVYRRYVDFGAFESLREMKAMIEREVRRKGMEDNVKLGPGGIREIEFIGQAFQLIRGGREPTLQAPRLLTVLEALRGFRMLPDYVVSELTDAYVFLRNTEHRLQEFADQQTHDLPSDDMGRARLAFAMGFDGWDEFENVLRGHMARVHSHFEQVFAAPQQEHAAADEHDLEGVWLGQRDTGDAERALRAAGFAEPGEALRLLTASRDSHQYRSLGSQGRQWMNRLLPLLLGAVGATASPERTLQRVLDLLGTVARRTTYLALLVENPMALSQLVRLCGASPWIATLLGRHPLLLDELLDPRTLYSPPDRDALENDLRQRLLNLPADDLEQQMDALRHFKQINVLRVAAADIAEAVPLMVVSDHLTWIAEVVLDEVIELAWRYMVGRHGRPVCRGEQVCDKGFAVVAYGKLGGIELGYGSDLDIVFVHSSEDENRMTQGEKPIANGVFFARLAQRVIHILNTRTPAGVLYEADLRLRPSGASGLMVSGLDAFAEYQRERAWTWEHQALVRARVVAGDPGIAAAFNAIRRDVLGRERDQGELKREVREMRERMRSNLSKAEAGQFDLKQDPGGIADIEFVVQYGVLAWARAHPALLDHTDNIRLLEAFTAAGLLPADETAALSNAYRSYRAKAHRLALQEQPAVVAADEFATEREAVQRSWRALMET